MAEVNIKRDPQKDLTSIIVTGQLTADDIASAINHFYENPTRLVLWEAENCQLDELSATDLEKASKLISKVKKDRPEGKTAFVIEKENFGLAVLFEGFTRMENLPYEYRSFTSHDEAISWLSDYH